MTGKGERVIGLRSAGMNNRAIAAEMGMPEPSVRRLISETRGRGKADSAGRLIRAEETMERAMPGFVSAFYANKAAGEIEQRPAAIGAAGRGAAGVGHLSSTARTAAPKPTHLIVPDTQCKPGVPLDHLLWAGKYIRERKPDVVIHLGDHWDFESLSSYDKGKKSFEGRRFLADVEAGNEGLRLLEKGMGSFRPKRKILLRGNHEDRLSRLLELEPYLEGTIGFHQLNDVELGWEVVPFLTPIEVDGITYSHFFPQPLSGRPYSGSIDTMIKNIGFTFTAGHTQGLWWGRRELGNGAVRIGLVAGSYYLHDEIYKGVQGNHHWRGLIVKHEVDPVTGYDPMFVSIGYLQNRYAA
jgi:hypothetical protein